MVIPTFSKWMHIGNLDADEDYTFYATTFNGASGSEPSEKVTCRTYTKGGSEGYLKRKRKKKIPARNLLSE